MEVQSNLEPMNLQYVSIDVLRPWQALGSGDISYSCGPWVQEAALGYTKSAVNLGVLCCRTVRTLRLVQEVHYRMLATYSGYQRVKRAGLQAPHIVSDSTNVWLLGGDDGWVLLPR